MSNGFHHDSQNSTNHIEELHIIVNEDLIEELYSINSNLHALDQLLEEQLTHLSQIGLPTSNDDLLILYHQHKVRTYTIYSIGNHLGLFRWQEKPDVF